MRRTIAIITILMHSVFLVRQVPAAEIGSVTIDGTAFVVSLNTGTVMRSPDLAGALLIIATSSGQLRLRIDAVERDPDAVAGPVWLHSFSIPAADGMLHPRELALLRTLHAALGLTQAGQPA